MKSQTGKRGAKSALKQAAKQRDSGQSSPDNNNEDNFRSLNEQRSRAGETAEERLQRISQINLSDDEGGHQTSGSSGRGGSGLSSGSDDEGAQSSSGRSSDAHKRSSGSLSSAAGDAQPEAVGQRDGPTSVSGCLGGADMKETGWNFVPQRREAVELLDQIRLRFLDSLKERDEETKYDQLDVLELRKALPSHNGGDQLHQSLAVRLISRFIDLDRHVMLAQEASTNGEAAAAVEKAIVETTEKLRDLLQFRHHYQLSNVMADQFCKEIYLLHGMFPFGRDKNQLPIMYLRARVHRRLSKQLEESFKRYVAWQVDVMTKSNHGAQVVRSLSSKRNIKDGSFGICFDCLNVSYSCVDMDFLSYLVKILVHYYPTYCRYALCVDLPWLFRSVWKLVRSWLPEEAQKTVHLITSKQLTEFIDEDQVPNSMKINDLPGDKKSPKGKHRMPEHFDKFRDLNDLAEELNLSSSEIKQLTSHVEKVVKEYEQLGAL